MDNAELRKILEDIADSEGRITREDVVRASSSKNHPLHKDPNFCWGDDREAARRHRLEYAGTLIRRVFVIRRPTTRRQARVPYFVRDPRVEENEQGHVSLEKVEPSSSDAVIIARDEIRRVMGILKRTAAVLAVLQMEDANNDLAEMLRIGGGLQARLTEPLIMESAASESEE